MMMMFPGPERYGVHSIFTAGALIHLPGLRAAYP